MIETLFPGLAALPNMHPLLVHFPIAFFYGALVMEGAAVLYSERLHIAATWMLYLGTLSAIVTLSTGFSAMNAFAAAGLQGHSGPDDAYIHVHRNWMVAVTLVAIVLALYLFWINRRQLWVSQHWRLLSGLAVLAALVALGADRGARLVFEFGIGVNPRIINVTTQESHHGDR